MLTVALTGGIGSGKSLAGELFADLGAIVVDSDQLAREVIARGTDGFDEVIARFGDGILREGDIDRSALGTIIFSDSQARIDLQAITHPRIQAAFAEIVGAANPHAVIINQIPLLVETAGRSRFDKAIAISAPLEVRTARLLARGMKVYEIEKRLAAQASDEERAAIADYHLVNDGDRDHLLRQVEELWELLQILATASNA
jgi:dephospho-CoA kinase